MRGSGGIQEIGTNGGYHGHVLVALSCPSCVRRHAPEARPLRAIWPLGANELWQVRTLECTRRVAGLHQSDLLVHIHSETRLLIAVGDISVDRKELGSMDDEPVEVWQSPRELRADLRIDLMRSVVADMYKVDGDWSFVTAARAWLMPAQFSNTDRSFLIEEMEACWNSNPICTSVIIVFWQRYICKLVKCGLMSADVVDLIMKFMPLKADRGLPDELLTTMRACGWTSHSRA